MDGNGTSAAEPPCPARAFRYNGTLCACDPGHYMAANGSCELFETGGEWVVGTAASPEPRFLSTVLPLETIKRVTQSQAVLLEATLLVLVLWLALCLALRFKKLRDGRNAWFRIRWWISRADVFFNTNHWVDDNKVLKKRKTELGGTFSMATWILFLGLLSALLYQIIARWNVEVYTIRPANAPDLLSFVNDMEFNITTISSMSCTHLRGLDTLVIGTPGFIDYRVFPLATYLQHRCQNTSSGPSISLKCNSCQIPRRSHYISWQFVDLPNSPAIAAGFQFNFSAKSHDNDKHASFVSGTMKSESYKSDKPKSFRGLDTNVLEIHLFPQTYKYLHNLKLIQPLFYDFIPGTSYSEVGDLKASLQSSRDGLLNTTLRVSYVADYIMEINKESTAVPVGFLADVGGLYAISLAIFLCFLIQCESRVKKLREEDSVMQNILSNMRAQRNWDKLRKFVKYTWGPCDLDVDKNSSKRHSSLTIDSFRDIGAPKKISQPNRNSSMHPDKTKEMLQQTESKHS